MQVGERLEHLVLIIAVAELSFTYVHFPVCIRICVCLCSYVCAFDGECVYMHVSGYLCGLSWQLLLTVPLLSISCKTVWTVEKITWHEAWLTYLHTSHRLCIKHPPSLLRSRKEVGDNRLGHHSCDLYWACPTFEIFAELCVHVFENGS